MSVRVRDLVQFFDAVRICTSGMTMRIVLVLSHLGRGHLCSPCRCKRSFCHDTPFRVNLGQCVPCCCVSDGVWAGKVCLKNL